MLRVEGNELPCVLTECCFFIYLNKYTVSEGRGDVRGSLKRTLDPLELELQATLSPTNMDLERRKQTENLRFSGILVYALNFRVISPAPRTAYTGDTFLNLTY